jgi:hypothetical protein
MANWQYAWLTDQPYTTIGFSHPQSGLAGDLAGVLGPGVLMQQSNEWSISLDRSRVNLGYVSGLMGDRGWEMFAVETRLQPNAMTPSQLQTNWYFKKAGPDRPAQVSVAAESTAAMAPAAPAAPVSPAISTYGQPAAPVAPAAPAMPTYSQPSAPASAPEMAPAAPAMPEAPTMPAAPAAPAGPDQAPMSGGTTPPPGPGGYTPSGG